MVEKMAYCGRDCSKCRAFEAMRSSKYAWMDTASKIEKELGLTINFQGITCGGCKGPNKTLVAKCRTCRIRRCCREKGHDSCDLCDNHPCSTLELHQEETPFMQTCLEVLTKALGWTTSADKENRNP